LARTLAHLAGGRATAKVCRDMGINDATYSTWRKKYGRVKVYELRPRKELQKENAQLKTLLVDLSLDKAILQEELEDPARQARAHGF
jgi:putative transposase